MSEQERRTRVARLSALREAGVEAYPARTGPFDEIAALRSAHDAKDATCLEAEANRAAVVGRVKSHRSFGKLVFFTLVQNGANLQVSARAADAGEAAFAFAREVEVADFVRVEGVMWRTKKGELTLAMQAGELLAKALRPLPEKWHGLKDTELRYRRRYLDLLANERTREIALLRSRVVSALRAFLDGRGFLEVETPVLQPLYGGAAARPFTTHHEVYDEQLFLRISDELYLKRLLIGGIDRVYEIAHNFRNEGISHKHSPEFTMLECYAAYGDYETMMALVQGMVQEVAQQALSGLRIEARIDENGEQGGIELGGDWRRLTMQQALLDAVGVDILEADDLPKLRAALRANGVDAPDAPKAPSWARLVDELFSEHVEPGLQNPTFITHHPLALSPLAKQCPEDPRLAERFELFIGGMELANAFSELNDPFEQRARFEAERAMHREGDEESHPMDEDFLVALEHGMPPAGGLGVGIDRLVRLLAGAPNLREVILFPHLRREEA